MKCCLLFSRSFLGIGRDAVDLSGGRLVARLLASFESMGPTTSKAIFAELVTSPVPEPGTRSRAPRGAVAAGLKQPRVNRAQAVPLRAGCAR